MNDKTKKEEAAAAHDPKSSEESSSANEQERKQIQAYAKEWQRIKTLHKARSAEELKQIGRSAEETFRREEEEFWIELRDGHTCETWSSFLLLLYLFSF
jgi:hypothetical protein